MFQGFREFIARGNVLDLAVGVVLGTAFGTIVTAFVNDLLMRPIGVVLGKVDFSNLVLDLSGMGYSSVTAAKQSGAATINYGPFLNSVIDFLSLGFVIFLLIRQVNCFMPKKEVEPPPC
jgi:large conductance mechanosensitive channel